MWLFAYVTQVHQIDASYNIRQIILILLFIIVENQQFFLSIKSKKWTTKENNIFSLETIFCVPRG